MMKKNQEEPVIIEETIPIRQKKFRDIIQQTHSNATTLANRPQPVIEENENIIKKEIFEKKSIHTSRPKRCKRYYQNRTRKKKYYQHHSI